MNPTARRHRSGRWETAFRERPFMNVMKRVYCQAVKVVRIVRRWRQLTAESEQEAERLDRIRNPSKYLGK
jgi:hypothetical protein